MQSTRVALAVAFGGALIAWALFSSMGGTLHFPWFGKGGHASAVRPIAASDHIFGNPAAPVKIVVYCDFTSPYCQTFYRTMHELIATDGSAGQVAWVYRHFPLQTATSSALALSEAAECAGKAGGNAGFWRFADALYANQPVESAQFGVLASQAALPTDAFAKCYADAKNQVGASVEADRKNALAIGASGTPYSIIIAKGRAPTALDGTYPYDQLRQALETALPGN